MERRYAPDNTYVTLLSSYVSETCGSLIYPNIANVYLRLLWCVYRLSGSRIELLQDMSVDMFRNRCVLRSLREIYVCSTLEERCVGLCAERKTRYFSNSKNEWGWRLKNLTLVLYSFLTYCASSEKPSPKHSFYRGILKISLRGIWLVEFTASACWLSHDGRVTQERENLGFSAGSYYLSSGCWIEVLWVVKLSYRGYE